MRYELMLPHQIRTAIDGHWPVVLPLGVLEYHGEHMAVGMDTLAVTGILEILESETNLVILPPFIMAPRATRSNHRNAQARFTSTPRRCCPSPRRCSPGSYASASETFTSSSIIRLRISPSACRRTSPSSSRPDKRSLPSSRGSAERDGGAPSSMAAYYASQSAGDDPFNWIKAHPLLPSSVMESYPFDHAGQGETSLLLALMPEGVDQSRISSDKWYSGSARDASAELGMKGRDRILAHLRRELCAERANAHSARN